MFQSLANALNTGIFGQGVLNNALLESFTVHARILLDFLYADRPRKDDVIADDFFDDPTQWSKVRSPKSEALQKIHRRVGKEIAHLTYVRQDVTSETKPWAFIEIANEVSTTFSKFLSLVTPDLLGPRWNEHKQQKEDDKAG